MYLLGKMLREVTNLCGIAGLGPPGPLLIPLCITLNILPLKRVLTTLPVVIPGPPAYITSPPLVVPSFLRILPTLGQTHVRLSPTVLHLGPKSLHRCLSLLLDKALLNVCPISNPVLPLMNRSQLLISYPSGSFVPPSKQLYVRFKLLTAPIKALLKLKTI